MIGADIRNGDLVIVRQQQLAENGDIVVAMLNGETTVKRLSFREDLIELKPENRKFKAIQVTPDCDFRLLGKVVGVRRVSKF
jgi:repressor LexA